MSGREVLGDPAYREKLLYLIRRTEQDALSLAICGHVVAVAIKGS